MAWFLFMIKGIGELSAEAASESGELVTDGVARSPAFLALVAFGWSGYKTWAAKNRKKARGRRDW